MSVSEHVRTCILLAAACACMNTQAINCLRIFISNCIIML